MSKHISLPRSRMWRTRAATALAAAGALVMSGGLVMLAAPAATATTGDPHKVWICHATSSDSNPYVAVYVDVASKKYEGHLMHRDSPNKFWKSDGTWNGESHGVGSAQSPNKRDYIQGLDFPEGNWDEGALCNSSNEGEDEPVVPHVDVIDNCGTENDSYTVTNAVVDDGDVVQFTYAETAIAGGVRLTFTAAKGFSIAEQYSTFDVLWPNDEACPLDIPAPPTVSGPNCDSAGSFTVTPHDGMTTFLNSVKVTAPTFVNTAGDYVIGYIANPGTVFTTGKTRATQDLKVLAATGPCTTQTRSVPPAPTPSLPTCDVDGSLTLPAAADGLTWAIQQISGTTDNSSPYGPGVYRVTVTSSGLPFSTGGQTYTYPDITVAPNTGPCVLGAEEIAPAITFKDATCQKPNRASWSGNLNGLVDYSVTGDMAPGNDVTITMSIKPAVADQFALAASVVNPVEHSFPSVDDLNCPTVKGSESSRPKPHKTRTPTVLGTQAVAPTAVDAGLASLPSSSATSTTSLLAQLLVAGGLLLLLAGGWLGLGRREDGAHEA